MLSIHIPDRELARVELGFRSTERQIVIARTRALRDMRKVIKTAVLQRVSKEKRIPQKALAGRIYFSNVPNGAQALTTWVGAWKLSLFKAGTPKQTKKGVSVGRLRYPGAFITAIYSATPQVWIRLKSPYFDPERYPTKKRPGDRGISADPRLRGRFPVVRAAIRIDETVKKVFDEQENDFRNAFLKNFNRQLNYEVNIKGKR